MSDAHLGLGTIHTERRMYWPSIAVGVATTLALLVLVLIFLSRFLPEPMPEGVDLSGPVWVARVVLSASVALGAFLLAFILGSFVAGLLVSPSPGLGGAISALLAATGGFVWYTFDLMVWIFVVPDGAAEAYTRNDNLGTLEVLLTGFAFVLPFIVLAGYLGGRLGSRLQNRATA